MLSALLGRFWPAIAFVVWTLLAARVGWHIGCGQERDRGVVTIAKLRAEESERLRLVAQAALERIQDAQTRADFLEKRLAEADQTRQTQAEEHAREIKRLTTGRPCLNAGTVRLLNQSAGGLRAPAMPASAGGLAAADAPAASDTDVAGWADNTRRQYDTCRDRLDALIDWHEEPNGHR